MVEISKKAFWSTYEKMDEIERKTWLLELREHSLVDDRDEKKEARSYIRC